MIFGCCAKISELPIVEKTGFDYIELPGNVLATLDDEETEVWCSRIRSSSIPCLVLNAAVIPSVAICGEDYNSQAVEEYFKVLCRRAGVLGAGSIGIGSPGSRHFSPELGTVRAWKQTEDFLKVACNCAAENGISILWEPLNSEETQFGVDSLESAEHIEKLRSQGIANIGMVADLYHMAQKGEGADVLKQLLPLIKHVHVARVLDEKRGYPETEDLKALSDILDMCRDIKMISVEAFSGTPDREGAKYLKIIRKIME